MGPCRAIETGREGQGGGEVGRWGGGEVRRDLIRHWVIRKWKGGGGGEGRKGTR